MSNQIVQCTNCDSLKSLYNRIQCTLLYFIKNKYNNKRFNTSLPVNKKDFQDLKVYERVVKKRIFNPSYPCSSIDSQDIISKVSTLVMDRDCSQCEDCFPELSTTTTTILE